MNTISHQIYYKGDEIGNLVICKKYNGIFAYFKADNMRGILNKIGGYAFNWFQVCTQDNNPPYDMNGHKIDVPYIDPYPGGFALEKDKSYMYWNDRYPWYWDVSTIKTLKEFNGQYDITCALSHNLNGNLLYFEDNPYLKKDSSLHFITWLVCIDSEYRLLHTFIGFSWSVKRDKEGMMTIDIDDNINMSSPNEYLS